MTWGELPSHVRGGLSRVGDGECWLWRGATCQGYAMTTVQGKHWYVHRLVYAVMVGPIPDGYVIDHLCRKRNCANPQHLEAVTHEENVRRGSRGAMTECSKGHAYTEENTYFYKRGKSPEWHRKCRVCRRDNYDKQARAAGVPERASVYKPKEKK